MATWRKLITNEMNTQNETWTDVLHHTLTEQDLDTEFDDGYGGPEGKPFTLWTEKRVYFPTCYDGAESVESVPRNPINEPTKHIGGY